MKIDPYCQRRNCSPLSALFSDVQYRLRWYRTAFPCYGASSKCGVGKSYSGAKSSISLARWRWRLLHYFSSNKSLTGLQLVFTSNWSNFRHDFASRGFLSVSWAFLFVIRVLGSTGNHGFSVTGPTICIANRSNIGPIINANGQILTDSTAKANVFNAYFSCVGIADNGNIPVCTSPVLHSVLDSIVVAESDVLWSISRLD